MRREQVIYKVATTTGIATADVDIIVKRLLDVIKEEVGNGKRVDFREFGSFLPRKRKAKKGRDISRNKTIDIPERTEPSFRHSKNFFTIKPCTT